MDRMMCSIMLHFAARIGIAITQYGVPEHVWFGLVAILQQRLLVARE